MYLDMYVPLSVTYGKSWGAVARLSLSRGQGTASPGYGAVSHALRRFAVAKSELSSAHRVWHCYGLCISFSQLERA